MADNKFQTPEAMARCVPMSSLQAVLSGKWKILILWYVAFYQVQRFGELMRRLDGITQSTLTKQLRELEADGFLRRTVPGILVRIHIPRRAQMLLAPKQHLLQNWYEALSQLCQGMSIRTKMPGTVRPPVDAEKLEDIPFQPVDNSNYFRIDRRGNFWYYLTIIRS